jgi:hypothetical protein
VKDILIRAKVRQEIAERILDELDLVDRWSRYGRCNVVGAVAYGLVVKPDIDLEIFCPATPKIEDGFDVIGECALHPNVKKVRFWNALGPPHHGLYWQIVYDHAGQAWKIDMWAMAESYAEPCGSRLTEPMLRALSDESWRVILRLKEAVMADASLECPSIQIYRAVLDNSVSTLDELREWLPVHPLTGVVTDWKPRSGSRPYHGEA